MNSAKFSSGTKKARVSLASLAQGAMAVNAAMQIAQSTFRGFEFVAEKLYASAQGIDRINDLSDKTGFSTESIAAMQYAAEQSGVEIESLNGSLSKMNATLGKAKAGGESAKAFKRLGLDVATLIAMEPDKAFSAIAERISQLPTPAEKAAAAVSIFGKSGSDLLNVLNLGSAGLAQFREQADRLGLTFNKLDSAKIGAAFDVFASLGKVFEGTGRQAVAAYSDEILVATFRTKYLLEELMGDNPLFAASNAWKLARENFATNLIDALGLASKKKDEFAGVTDDLEDSLKKENAQLKKMHSFYDALYERESARFDLIEASLSPQEKYLQKQYDIAQLLKQLDKDRFGYTTPLIGQEDYDEQKSRLEGIMEQNRVDEEKRAKAERKSSYGGQLAELMKSPLQKYNEAIAEIDKKTDPIFGGEGSDFLSTEQAKFAKLQARKSYLESLPDPEEAQTYRQSALVRGSSEAFSASFGNKAADKTLAEIKDIERQMLILMQQADKPVVVTLP